MSRPGLAIYTVSKHVTPKDLLTFGPAFTQQVTDVADAWGLRYPIVHIVESAAAVPAGFGWIVLADDLADNPDALAYHTKTVVAGEGVVSGVCDVEKILALQGTLARGSLSVTAATGHELAEATVDPPCNRYAQAPNGDVWCLEDADPVQGFVYKSRDGKADLSDFVKPDFFDLVIAEAYESGELDHATVSFDHAGYLDAPFSVGPGGYAIVLRRGRAVQLGAETPAHKRGLPSRRARRLADLERHFGSVSPAASEAELADDVIALLNAAAAALATLDPAEAASIKAKIDALLKP